MSTEWGISRLCFTKSENPHRPHLSKKKLKDKLSTSQNLFNFIEKHDDMSQDELVTLIINIIKQYNHHIL